MIGFALTVSFSFVIRFLDITNYTYGYVKMISGANISELDSRRHSMNGGTLFYYYYSID